MSMYTLPCLYLSLGKEMLFILEQRLEAQEISLEKQQKVIKDVVGQFLSDLVLSSLFTSQPAPTRKRLKTNFSKLAHSSIMKLNSEAMDKLFDLMLMAVKYQILLCKSGHEVLMLTLSHLDSVRTLVSSSPQHIEMVNKTCTKFIKTYKDFNPSQLALIRHTILNCIQDYYKKVSVFLAQNIQLKTGRFVLPIGGPVPFGSELPGKVVYHYKECGKTDIFTVPVRYTHIERKGSMSATGERGIDLNMNLYSKETKSQETIKAPDKPDINDPSVSEESLGSHAELHLLQNLLIGFQSPSTSVTSFKLNLFDEEDDDGQPTNSSAVIATNKPKENRVNITSCKNATNTKIKEILEDFESVGSKGESKTEGDDLLSLMDTL